MPDAVVWLCSNTYTALNALAGHYNNFGPGAPVPKKRLDRVNKVTPADRRTMDVGSCLHLASSEQEFCVSRGGRDQGLFGVVDLLDSSWL